ncbi:MAG: FAD-dependent oxidoreductase [Hyphomicrobiales bacterium]|nr:FAD-dependent oxidoreductase [Hyphomicrobiales bacterium]
MPSERAMAIVGAGHAGGRAASALRDAGWSGPVTLIGAEVHTPHERPPLSKEVLRGAKTGGDCALYPDDFYRDRDINLMTGTTVSNIRRSTREIELSNERLVPFEKLLLATGAEPRRLDVPGADLDGVHVLRTIDQSRELAARLTPGARLTIVGGGLIGLEVAASAMQLGCSVSVVEVDERVLARVAPAAIAEYVAKRHQDAGVAFHLNRTVTAIAGEQTVSAVHLDDGTSIETDAVLISIGVTPRVDLAQRADLAVANGIATDATLRTEDPNIFAAGDACVFMHPLFGFPIRLESWKNAEDQGPLAARNMLGADERYPSVPWMWSDQFDFTIQVAGLPGQAKTIVKRQLDSDAIAVFDLAGDGQLIAVSAVGPVGAVARTVRLGQMMIERRSYPDPEALASPSTNLKALMRQQAA